MQILSCILIVIFGSAYSNDVVKLADTNFTHKLSDYKAALVKFYVPWCGHCKNLAPEFEKAAKALKSTTPPVTLIEVDCSADGKDTCAKNGIKGYPTLKVFKRGELAFDYVGPRHAEGIVQQIKLTVLPGSKELKTLADTEEFLNNDENCVIGFFEPTKLEVEMVFHRLADSLKDQYRFAHTYNNRVLSKYGYRNDIVIFRANRLTTTLEQPQIKYEGEMTLYKLRSWITEHYHGLVGVRTTLNMEQFRSPLVVVYYKLEFTGSKAKETSYWRNRVIMVARKFSAPGTRKVNFAISDAAEFSRELTDLGLIYTNVTPVVAARDLSERRFVMHEPLSMENLEQFAEGVVNGSLIPYIKSAPRPENNNEPVKIVVGNTFEEIVNDATKDVLIYFHSPWCGECLEIDKKLVKLAKKLKDDKNIVIASMDATTNDAPKQYIIKGFPSIFIATKASKMTPKVFEGKYEVDELLTFIAQQATEPLHRHKEKTDSVIKSRSQRIEL